MTIPVPVPVQAQAQAQASTDQTRVVDLATLAGLEACRFGFMATEARAACCDSGAASERRGCFSAEVDRKLRVADQSGQG